VNLKLWFGILVSAAFLWIATWNVDFRSAWEYAQGVNVAFLIPYMALVVAEIFLRAWKWLVILEPVKRASFRNLSSATLIGLMANNILPARAGEFVRAYVGARMERIPFSTSFATVVIDRVLDGLTVSAIFILAVIVQPLPDEIKGAGYLAATIYGVALGSLLVLILNEQWALRVIAKVLSPFPRRFGSYVVDLAISFAGGLSALRSPRLLLSATGISVLIWLGYALSVYFMALAFGIELTVMQSFVVLLIVTIALTLPSTPGFVGTMELALKWGLVLFGIDESRAFAFALVYHVTQYVPITVAGLLALWLTRFSIRDIAHVPAPDAASRSV
jgi:uncharacterized protein (TIRG00374 family)